MPRKRQCLGRLREKPVLNLAHSPETSKLLLNLLQASANFAALPENPRKVEKNHHSFIRFSKLSCTMQVLIFSKIPLRSGNGPNWPIECDKLCASWHKIGTENGPQSGALLGAWLHVGPDTKSVT